MSLILSDKSSKVRNLAVDVVRIVASFLVILLHATSLGYFEAVDSTTWLQTAVLKAIASFGVPLFLIVTGYILLADASKIAEKWFFLLVVL